MSMTATRRIPLITSSFLLCLPLMLCARTMPVQAQCSGDNLSDESGYVVRSVHVKTLFGREPQKLRDILAEHKGESYRVTAHSFTNKKGITFSGSSRNIYQQEVNSFFAEELGDAMKDRSFGVNQHNSFYVRTTFLDDCVEIIPIAECRASLKDTSGNPADKCVDVTVYSKVIPINTSSLSANLLDIARSNSLRFYRELPRPLLALNPTFFIEHDRDYGDAAVVSTSTDLLNLFSLLKHKERLAQDTRLSLSLNARKALNEPFYDLSSNLSFSRSRPLKLIEQAGLDASFAANRQPKGNGTLFTDAGRVSGTLLMKFKQGPFSQLGLAAGYRRAGNRFFSNDSGIPAELTSEDAIESRAIIDGNFAKTFVRGAVWFDGASPEIGTNSYGRIATMFGLARELVLPQTPCKIARVNGEDTCVLPKNNPPAIGLEILFGFGRSWGSVPEYARFFAGNSTNNFLYAGLSEPSITNLPEGPLIRSMGRNQGAVVTGSQRIGGGTSYWHLNLSASIPIPKLSRPLIPSETIVSGTSCSDCASLKQMLKNQVANGKNIFIDALAVQRLTTEQRDALALDRDDGLTPEELTRLEAAERAFEQGRLAVMPEADAFWGKMTPMINYIADQANLFAIKPVLMFDVAGLSGRDEPSQRARLAVGGGLQFNIVVVKFEAGYMRTVRRLPGDERGNFVIRMLFERFF